MKKPILPQNKGTGALPSPDDYRDGIAALAIAPDPKKLPARYAADLSKMPVYDQMQQLSCVSNTIALELTLYWYRKTGKIIPFSPRFLDIMAKRFDGLGDKRLTAGTWARIVLKVAAKYGCATQKTVPDVPSVSILEYRDDAVITSKSLVEAEQYKIPGYVRIPTGTESLRAFLRVFEGVSVAFFVGEELYTGYDGVVSFDPAKISPLRPPKKISNGHQMFVYGWDADYNIVRNSWGRQWCSDGNALYAPSAWDPFTMEAWTIAEIPDDVKLLLSNLPAPTDFRYQWQSNLQLGDFNEDVKFLQIAYMILGLMDPVPPDQLGYFGAKTMAANGKYQRIKGVPVKDLSPANCGRITRGYLNEDFGV